MCSKRHECNRTQPKFQMKYSFFARFKRNNSAKNHRTKTKCKLDLYFAVIHLHIFKPVIHVNTSLQLLEWKLKISSRRMTLSKNHRTVMKFEFDLRIPMTYLYMQFQLYTYKVTERKLKKN
jgi:hypothetical protein